jgi:uncharacterized protein (DUF1015 family)
MDSECFWKNKHTVLADGIIVQPQQHIVRRKRDFENTAKDYLLSYLISENNVKIYEFNRLVKDLNGFERGFYKTQQKFHH